MEADIESRIRRTVTRVVEMLVESEYAQLEALTHGQRLRKEDLESGVSEYGKTLMFPPQSAYETIDIIPIDGSGPTRYSVRFPLYTQEEGRSDLELQATLVDEVPSTGEMRVEIDNILVA